MGWWVDCEDLETALEMERKSSPYTVVARVAFDRGFLGRIVVTPQPLAKPTPWVRDLFEAFAGLRKMLVIGPDRVVMELRTAVVRSGMPPWLVLS